jgi:outer membrane receptor for ferrienterochelin and colicins
MKKLIASALLLFIHSLIFSQNSHLVQGQVRDYLTNDGLPGATITNKNNSLATVCNDQGYFSLQQSDTGTVKYTVSYTGYEARELTVPADHKSSTKLVITLNRQVARGDIIVVTASRHPEKITAAPACIQVVTLTDINQFAGSNTTELLSKVLGLEYTRNGVLDVTFNARGMNSAFNNKIYQLVDGRNSMSALSAGLPVLNRGTTIVDDIERIEVVLGPQSALYGPNAHNAVYNTMTKDPRIYQGLTVSVSAGSREQFSSRIRYASKINSHWAFKLTGEYARGREFEFYDSVYAGGGPKLVLEAGGKPKSVFGDSVSIPERNVNFDFHYLRGEGSVYYSPNAKTDIIVTGGSSSNTWPQVTTAGRNQMDGVSYSFLQARLINPRFFVNIYNTWGSLGVSYPILNYTRDYWNRTHSLDTVGIIPGTKRLTPEQAEDSTKRRFKENDQRFNAEMQYNYRFQKIGLYLVAGLNYQREAPNGYGINLVDKLTKIRIDQYGGVLQLEESLPWKMRLMAATRVDYHSNFGTFVSPRFALTKVIGPGVARVSWGNAMVMPSIQNQYAGIAGSVYGNGGTGVYYQPNGVYKDNLADFKTTTPLVPEQVSTWEFGYKGAIGKKLFIDINFYDGLSKNFISPIRTVSGRAISLNGIAVYPSFPGMDSAGMQKDASFFTFFNYGDVRVYGIDAGIYYTINQYINVALKYSWFGSDITDNNPRNDANQDGYVSLEETSLNAPQNRALVIVNVQNLLNQKLFFGLTARWVEQYDFYSGSQIGTKAGKGSRGKVYTGDKGGKRTYQFKNFDWGPLGGFTTVDVTVGYQLNPTIRLNMGITNLFNTRQIEFVGSPSIQRLFMFEAKVFLPNKRK